MGRLIPAGTGLEFYRNFKLLTEAEPQQPEAGLAASPTEPVIPATSVPVAELADEDEARTV